MRAHSDTKNILIFEKHDEVLRRPSPSSASPALRSGSRCFFTCILRHFLPTQHCQRARHTQDSVRMKTHTLALRFPTSFSKRSRCRCRRSPTFVRFTARRSHLTSYETHIRTPRGSVARLRLNIASPPRTRELRQRACEAAEGRTRGSPARCMFLLNVG